MSKLVLVLPAGMDRHDETFANHLVQSSNRLFLNDSCTARRGQASTTLRRGGKPVARFSDAGQARPHDVRGHDQSQALTL
jgi:hypothetical protein